MASEGEGGYRERETEEAGVPVEMERREAGVVVRDLDFARVEATREMVAWSRCV